MITTQHTQTFGFITQVNAIICLPAAPAIPFMAEEEERREEEKKRSQVKDKITNSFCNRNGARVDVENQTQARVRHAAADTDS